MIVRSLVLVMLMLAFAACERSSPSSTQAKTVHQASAFEINPKFPGGGSIMLAAKKVFPESREIALLDFWMSEDATHEFAVFFVGREIKGSFESMYWRYLAFAKKKTDHDWSEARVFDLRENHPWAMSEPSLAWLEHNAVEQKEPNQAAQPTRGAAPHG